MAVKKKKGSLTLSPGQIPLGSICSELPKILSSLKLLFSGPPKETKAFIIRAAWTGPVFYPWGLHFSGRESDLCAESKTLRYLLDERSNVKCQLRNHLGQHYQREGDRT